MDRCKRCILPSDYPGIKLDENNVCNFCHGYKPFHSRLGVQELLKTINHSINNNQYDCVVPISGGKDSTYILYYIVKELKLKPIAVNYNSGLQSEIAGKNLVTTCEKLGVKLVTLKSRFSKRLIKIILLLSIKQNRRPYLSRFCRNCETILRTISVNTARKYGVANIIWGSSALESGSNEGYLKYKNVNKVSRSKSNRFMVKAKNNIRKLISSKDKYRKVILKINSKLFGWSVEIRYLPKAILFNLNSMLQRFEMKVPFRYAISPTQVYPFTENPKFIHFFDYVTWDSMKSVEILKKELSWKHPENKEDRFDCLYHGLLNYYAWKTNKITSDGVNYCNFIRENKLSRTEALEKELLLQEKLAGECEVVLKEVGLSKYKLF